MEDLPADVAMDILSRLPAKSIIQCKLVCKGWYHLLTNPNFVATHVAYQYQSSRNNLLFLSRAFSYPHGYEMCAVSYDNIDNPKILQVPSDRIKILIGHCDGLVAFSDLAFGVLVCNLTTQEFRRLPNISSLGHIPYDPIDTYGPDQGVCASARHAASNHIFGFGYDPRTKDYKIVRVVTFIKFLFPGGRMDNGTTHRRAEVFGIRADSRWRELLDVNIDFSVNGIGKITLNEPYFDGVCYWWGRDDKTQQKLLISFDLEDEIFTKTPIPSSVCLTGTFVQVGIYNNSVAIYDQVSYERIDIWVVGVKGSSWNKQLTIEPFLGVNHIGFFNGSDVEFLYEDRDGQLAMYNRITKESKTVSPRVAPWGWVSVPYMKTIVSVKSAEDIVSVL